MVFAVEYQKPGAAVTVLERFFYEGVAAAARRWGIGGVLRRLKDIREATPWRDCVKTLLMKS
jgi:hypothetical protein